MMHQMFTIDERSGLQAGQFSTRTLLLRSHAVVIAAVCGFALSCWNTRRLEGSICCSKSFTVVFFYLLVFDRIHDAMHLNKMSRTSSRNIGSQHQKIQQYISLYTWGTFYPCVHQTHLEGLLLKAHFLVSSDHRSQSHLKFQSCLITEYAGDCFLDEWVEFFLKPSRQHVVIFNQSLSQAAVPSCLKTSTIIPVRRRTPSAVWMTTVQLHSHSSLWSVLRSWFDSHSLNPPTQLRPSPVRLQS